MVAVVVDVGDGLVLDGREATIMLGVYKVALDRLRAGVDGRVGGLGALERHLDPVVTAVSPIDLDFLLLRQRPAAGEGGLAQVALVPAQLCWWLAGVVFADVAGNVLVVVDCRILVQRRAVAAEDDFGRLRLEEGALRCRWGGLVCL